VTDLYDAFTWQNLQPLAGPVAAYRDGRYSTWPAQAFQALEGRIFWNITVLADEAWEVFDAETGNAGNDAVATAIANRFQDRKWSVAYSNAANLPALTVSLRRKGLYWTDMQFWPEPGVYLWAASPGTTPGRTPPWCPVAPAAVQDRWGPLYNVSTLYVARTPAPGPAPHPAPVPEEIDMFLAVATNDSTLNPAIKNEWQYVVTDAGLAYVGNTDDAAALAAKLGPPVRLTGDTLARFTK